MEPQTIDSLGCESPFAPVMRGLKNRLHVMKRVIREPLYRQRKKLGRCWSTPDDYSEAHKIARFECRRAGIRHPDEHLLYIETNKMVSIIAHELFPNGS